VQEVFITFPELRDHGIRASRVSVNKWMDLGIFPPSIRISPNRVGWSIFSIELFKASRPDAREPAPRLWPPRERPVKPVDPAKPVGRPRGSKVVRGPDGRRRLVRPEELREAGDAAA
jgi:predicted DNA-binding transcriptional regulator AlpA